MSHRTNDLFHNFFFPYLMQDRAYPLDIDESLSTNEYVNKIGKVTKSVIDDITNVENRVEKLENDIPTSDEIIALADTVVKEHVVRVKYINDKFINYDGEELTPEDIYNIYNKGVVVLTMPTPVIMQPYGYDTINAVCTLAKSAGNSYEFKFVFSDTRNAVEYDYNGLNFTTSYKTNIDTDNIGQYLKANTVIITPDFENNTMLLGDNVYTVEDFERDHHDKKNVILETINNDFRNYYRVNTVVETSDGSVTRVEFIGLTVMSIKSIYWDKVDDTAAEFTVTITNVPKHVHLYCDGEGICDFRYKDTPYYRPYYTFNEIKRIIEDDNNIVFITNGYYSFYSKYYYHTAISQQDVDAIGFIGETQLNGHAYSWRIAINEHNEVTEDEIRLVGSNEMNSYVKESLVNNDIVLTAEEKLKIEAWLGLSENYLTYYNATPYSVNADYVPAHKKYVDDAINGLNEIIGSGDFNNG